MLEAALELFMLSLFMTGPEVVINEWRSSSSPCCWGLPQAVPNKRSGTAAAHYAFDSVQDSHKHLDITAGSLWAL